MKSNYFKISVRLLHQFLFCLVFLVSCREDDKLTKIDLYSDVYYKIDTLFQIDRTTTLLLVSASKFMDDFDSYYAISKRCENNTQLTYRFPKIYNRVNKKFVYSVKQTKRANWGWFFKKDGLLVDSLPNIQFLVDSLEQKFLDSNLHLVETNGYLEFLRNGTPYRTYNYGEFLNNSINYDSLEPGLYKFENNNLHLLSQNSNDFLKQKEGLYYVPFPGYGVTRQHSLGSLISKIKLLKCGRNAPKNLSLSD